MTEVNCIICNKKFYPRYKKSKTCSKFCWEKNYKTTDKYKERKKAWNQSEKGKLWSNSYSKEYRKNNPDMMREIRIKYENTDKSKIKNKKYDQSEKGKKSKKNGDNLKKVLITGEMLHQNHQRKNYLTKNILLLKKVKRQEE